MNTDKEKSTEKIDGAVATIMDLDRAIRCGVNTGASVYDERGVFFILIQQSNWDILCLESIRLGSI